jgi:dolichol-phosphate mannosyltransferase
MKPSCSPETLPVRRAAPTREAAPRQVFVVLPAYNEAANVGAVLRALSNTGKESGALFHAIVVDDGSHDRTADAVRAERDKLPLTLLEHPSNLGLGATIRDGLLKAVDMAGDGDVIVTMDADDTHAPAAIEAMVAKIDQGYDVLIASRYVEGSQSIGVPFIRRFLSYGASLLFRAVHPISGVKDFTCGYRAYRASVLRAAVARYRQEFIDQDGFQCMVDILLKLSRMNLRFGEVPLVLRYDRKGGKSKMKILPTALRTLALLVTRRLGL